MCCVRVRVTAQFSYRDWCFGAKIFSSTEYKAKHSVADGCAEEVFARCTYVNRNFFVLIDKTGGERIRKQRVGGGRGHVIAGRSPRSGDMNG